jgi:hypothetical protein
MFGGLSYQALGPFCVLARDYCCATFACSAPRLPAARGPPELRSAGLDSGPIRPQSRLQLLPDMTLGQAVGPR